MGLMQWKAQRKRDKRQRIIQDEIANIDKLAEQGDVSGLERKWSVFTKEISDHARDALFANGSDAAIDALSRGFKTGLTEMISRYIAIGSDRAMEEVGKILSDSGYSLKSLNTCLDMYDEIRDTKEAQLYHPKLVVELQKAANVIVKKMLEPRNLSYLGSQFMPQDRHQNRHRIRTVLKRLESSDLFDGVQDDKLSTYFDSVVRGVAQGKKAARVLEQLKASVSNGEHATKCRDERSYEALFAEPEVAAA